MKTVTMPFDEFLALEGEIRALKSFKKQQDELIEMHLSGMTPEELQKIRSEVAHPFWTHADRQLQMRQANYEISTRAK